MAKREMKLDLVTSDDGSHTIRIPELKEHYHSHKGAIRESMHVFITNGFRHTILKSVRLLEIGFGTGLNALLTALEAKNVKVEYVALEPFPLEKELVSKLNYPSVLKQAEAKEIFQKIHAAQWEQSEYLTENFSLKKSKSPFQTFQSSEAFDVIYYDAFAPHAQPELWQSEIWIHAKKLLRPNGVLVTYCAKGQVRRDMQAAGLFVERLEGPPGKREMLRAIKYD